ncbi:hypothetical protein [Bacillus cereus]|uniref:hypothetical protein n=1 Tax=Bacillus cereus TaxID=1396 RepID=UPI000BF3E9AF|nr:hypothetical protein [Bacillus cereus]PFA92935.1 hypothetical protein CN393_01150 [Bacillus cereus]
MDTLEQKELDHKFLQKHKNNLQLLITKEDFYKLEKGELIFIVWEKGSHFEKNIGEITKHKVLGINKFNELMIDDNRSASFNIYMYAMQMSVAIKVYRKL